MCSAGSVRWSCLLLIVGNRAGSARTFAFIMLPALHDYSDKGRARRRGIECWLDGLEGVENVYVLVPYLRESNAHNID